MSKKIKTDINKPYYINSYNADEVIFHMIRGTRLKTGNYDASFPVSLESLKIKKLCEDKKVSREFSSVFRTVGNGDNSKTYSDAVINIKFSNQGELSKWKNGAQNGGVLAMDQIRNDYDSFCKNGIDFESLIDGKEIDEEFSKNYQSFLRTYQENQESIKKAAGNAAKVEKNINLAIGEKCSISHVSVTTERTRIKVVVKVDQKRGSANKKSDSTCDDAAIRLYIVNYAKDRSAYRICGIYEEEDIYIKEKSSNVKMQFDIRDLMETRDEDGGGFLLKKGNYILCIGAGEDTLHILPVVSLEVPEELTGAKKNISKQWLDETEWNISAVKFGAECDRDKIETMELDIASNRTYKECMNLYKKMLIRGSKKLLKQCNMELSSDEEEYVGLSKRVLLYHNGIDIENKNGQIIHYRLYKRSAGKSKEGSCLFIWDRLYDEMFKWSWMGFGFEPDKKYDLTSVRAYEALTLSSIQKTFRLKPENILIMEALEGKPVLGNRRIVCKVNADQEEKLIIKRPEECAECSNQSCREKMTEYRNNLWDGQALLDESVFNEVFQEENGNVTQHGMMLLRNKFFKACAFNTKIQEFYRANHIKKVYDMFRKEHNAEDIKLIITPDSLKILKFDGVFCVDGKAVNKQALYKRWKKEMDVFGVVKWDKSTDKHGKYKVGYQILNTLPLDRNKMETLFKPEKEYIERLWRDDGFFVKQIPQNTEKGKFIYELYNAIGGFSKTQDYIQYKRQMISDHKRKLRRGEIYLKGDMYVLCSLPYEMLWFSGYAGKGKKDRENAYNNLPIQLQAGEAYIQGMENGDQIMLCRYPHLSSGSVCVVRDKEVSEYEKWFNLIHDDGKCNIVVISPWESNIMVKLGGADFDSDTALFIKDPVVLETAKDFLGNETSFFEKLGEYKPAVDGLPVAQAGAVLLGEGIKVAYTGYEMARLDNILARSQAGIGVISNDAQLFNCYLWEALNDPKSDEGYIKTIYECIMKYAVLNELEIDRAKHSIMISTKNIRQAIRETEYHNQKILRIKETKIQKIFTDRTTYEEKAEKAYYHPAFLFEIKKERGSANITLRGTKKDDKYWDCPSDHLAYMVSKMRKKREAAAEYLTVYYDTKAVEQQGQPNGKQMKKIEEILETAIYSIRETERNRLDSDEKFEERNRIRNEFLESFSKCKLTGGTMAALLRDTLNIKKSNGKYVYWNKLLYKNRYKVMGLLFMAADYQDKMDKGAGVQDNKAVQNSEVIRKALKGLKIDKIIEVEEEDNEEETDEFDEVEEIDEI